MIIIFRDAPDTDLAGYPKAGYSTPKAGRRISGDAGYPAGSKFKCLLNYEINKETRLHDRFLFILQF
jgi:hypothetical protein